MKVLIVEDDESIANLIKINLTAEGYKCVCAYDGKTGADYIEKGGLDLILLDIMLPEIDGYELLEYVKPFQIGELLARVEALLRRYGKINNKLTFADVEVDMVSRTVSK